MMIERLRVAEPHGGGEAIYYITVAGVQRAFRWYAGPNESWHEVVHPDEIVEYSEEVVNPALIRLLSVLHGSVVTLTSFIYETRRAGQEVR